jgi:N-acylneuraminate cytidylyltransferase/CMP-N,N'-diacetyllegionaminic acid synthase
MKETFDCWAFVPARGGSKSIPYKNLALLSGVPLLDYGIRAVQASKNCQRIIGSTDDDRIAERFTALGIECDRRPPELAADDTPVADVVREWLMRTCAPKKILPNVVILVQPTSPFLRPEDVSQLLKIFLSREDARSAQTIVNCPHNAHAWNQRAFEDGLVRFVHSDERKRAYNKQRKPKRWLFGNLIAVRVAALLAGEDFFATPSVGVEIERPYDFDVDSAADLSLAEALMRQGIVQLPHMNLASRPVS